MAHILVVDDDPCTRRALQAVMTAEGHIVGQAGDGVEALAQQQARRADLLILDINMPRVTGLEVLKALRDAEDHVPVVLLTSEGSEIDRLHGFMLGADDYVVKPHSSMELRLRVRSILKRLESTPRPPLVRCRSGAYHFDFFMQTATLDGAPVPLTPGEFKLLHALVDKAGATCTRQGLLQAAWPPDGQPSLRTVDVQVAHLRAKLDPEGQQRPIVTVPREGYRWAPPVTPET